MFICRTSNWKLIVSYPSFTRKQLSGDWQRKGVAKEASFFFFFFFFQTGWFSFDKGKGTRVSTINLICSTAWNGCTRCKLLCQPSRVSMEPLVFPRRIIIGRSRYSMERFSCIFDGLMAEICVQTGEHERTARNVTLSFRLIESSRPAFLPGPESVCVFLLVAFEFLISYE